MSNPFIFVLFGATGDLAKNKLIPSLFNLFKKKELPEKFWIVGFARRPFTDEEFRKLFPDVSLHPGWNEFAEHLFYQQGAFDEKSGYKDLVKRFHQVDKELKDCATRVFYLATPPVHYETILDNLKSTDLSNGCILPSLQTTDGRKWTRIAIEKPFGKDLQTAKELDARLAQAFEERQIFRVDHYLGKENMQNMIVFRFANGIFDPVWNNKYIDHVQITWAEKKGIAGRGKFFDGVGILRDVAQNHLMQMITAVAMDMPQTFSKEGIRDQRAKTIAALQLIEPEKVADQVVRGQYQGYLSEDDVDPNSKTCTFVAFKTFVNSPRFEGVPFYVRVGKSLKQSVAEINIVFKQTCPILFHEIGCPEDGNILKIRIQPHEGISLKIIAKQPGSQLSLGSVDMHFSYDEEFGTSGLDAYEKVLLDIISGEQMLFNRSDELASSWAYIEKILKGWENPEVPMYTYEKESWGPRQAQELIVRDGRKWINP